MKDKNKTGSRGGFCHGCEEKNSLGSGDLGVGTREDNCEQQEQTGNVAGSPKSPNPNPPNIEILKVEEAILKWIGSEDMERMKKYLLPSPSFKKKLLCKLRAVIRRKYSR